uniref:Uncharacterized protein n=1 Tax=Parascaris equorum TaxID=6256 RepID=A0A914R600_PAREQ
MSRSPRFTFSLYDRFLNSNHISEQRVCVACDTDGLTVSGDENNSPVVCT